MERFHRAHEPVHEPEVMTDPELEFAEWGF